MKEKAMPAAISKSWCLEYVKKAVKISVISG